MNHERGDGTQTVEMMEVIEKEKNLRWGEVDSLKEETGSRDMVRHIERAISTS